MGFFKQLFGLGKLKKLLPEDEKDFSKEEILFYARKRVADVFHLAVDEVELGDRFDEGRLKLNKGAYFGETELDKLWDDMLNSAWNDKPNTVLVTLYGENGPGEYHYVRNYCEYMVCCYQHCTKRSYKDILHTLNLKPVFGYEIKQTANPINVYLKTGYVREFAGNDINDLPSF